MAGRSERMGLRTLTLVAASAAIACGMARAQHYEPSTGRSPFTLLAVPADGIGYLQAREDARRLWREGKYAEAEPLLERLTRDYPRDAWNWMTLARVKSRLGKHLEAARANEKA